MWARKASSLNQIDIIRPKEYRIQNIMEAQRISVEFLPGFTNIEGTQVGTLFKNASFNLEYIGARYNKRRNLISSGFESCYDWTDVIDILLSSLENFKDAKSFEATVQNKLQSWFMTYSGWGLLTSLLPKRLQMMYIKTLGSVKRKWPLNFEGECTDEKCWNLVLQSSLKDLLPKCEVKVEDITNDGFDSKLPRGRKWISLIFSNQWSLEIRFCVEKKKSEVTLVNLSAKTVAECIKSNDDTDTVNALEIPLTLMTPIDVEMRALKWIEY